MSSHRARPRPSRWSSVAGVIGELLITAGVFVFLFLGWQLWLNDLILGADQRDEALALSQQFSVPEPSDEVIDHGEPVVGVPAANAEKFANIYIPRFGADYVRTIAEGVGASDVLRTSIGHYPETQMPGEVGNFAIAGHRTTYGAPFHEIASLVEGDRIYVQTAEGWYTYLYRSTEIVLPTAVEVVLPVPKSPGVEPTERMLTMTSCNPMFSAKERIITYSVLESWQPASAGAPEEIRALAEGGL